MGVPTQSREILTTMETCEQESARPSRSVGWSIKPWIAAAIGVGFLVLLVVTGVIVHVASVGDQPEQAPQSSVKPRGTTTHEVDTTSPTTKAPVQKTKDIRLPRSLKPISYVVRLQPFINGNLTIAGSMEMKFKVVEACRNVSMHMADIVTLNDTITLRSEGGAMTPSIIEHSYDQPREMYVAKLDGELLEGEMYVISMRFVGLLNDKLKGFYQSSYKDAQGKKVMLATTQFQPTDARRAFPCMDEPGLKAKFEIHLARQTNMTALSNMPVLHTEPIPNSKDWVWDSFPETVPMSTYLVAFIVSDFDKVISDRANTNDVLFRVWARPEAINQTAYAREIGPKITKFFENYFDLPFPLPKQDMVAIPDFSAGAMENWGLITYRETALLYDPKVSSAKNKERVAAVVSHELAHQWFGDLVTPSWWTDLWLNEGFASYLEDLGVDAVEPSMKMNEQFVSGIHYVFNLDCLENSHPISIPVGHPSEINEIFDSISYKKGAAIIRMMNHYLGESAFRKGLTNYLKHFKYSSAEQDDLWRFLTEQAHKEGVIKDMTVKTIMDTWTLQMGYPVLTVIFNTDGTADLTQERFLLVNNQNSKDKHDYKWWIPISYTSQQSPNFTDTRPVLWMPKESKTKRIGDLPPKNAWKVFNIQQTGYYRVNYDENNWKQLVDQLKANHKVIHIINRAQLLDDSLDLARSGRLSYDIALDVSSYLGKESEYVPWGAALNNLAFINNMLQRTETYGAFQKYILRLLEPLYNSVGFKENANDSHLDHLKRQMALRWACSMDHPECLAESANQYKMWMSNPSNYTISPNLKSLVYCNGIKQGGEAEWNFAWQQFMAANVASEKSKLLRSLGCTRKIWLLSKLLDKTYKKGSGIRKQDAGIAFGAIARNPIGMDLAWNYLREHWARIVEYYGSGLFALGRTVQTASAKFNTKLKLKELESFRVEYSESLTSAKRTVDQSIEKTRNNIQWNTQHYDVIMNWLNKNNY